MSTIKDYLERYALTSLEKQEKFNRLVGEHTAELDFEAGTVRFSGSFEFPFQVLGTESDNTFTWLWAWAEEQEEIPADVMKSSLELKAWGMSNAVTAFTTPSADLDQINGHAVSMIASEICAASCYYQDAYEGGALYLLLFGKEIDRMPSFDIAGLSRQFSHLMTILELDHRSALLSFLRMREIAGREEGSTITFELESGETGKAEFDPQGKLLSLNGKAMPLD